ncbi:MULTISPECIES: EAL domain-containing response regulator [Achromobacter]|jgi:EAL domain-containing protein (putative c-di-GMP-specific phosphodiesterase class I)|uniref:EAL domain-containing response regulator n=1 Tax=Achromobacter TaxID=222 RepID=UPI0006C40A50|nr:EAL domain-containing response regulator [Achromobacter kerstersii]CUI89531.1 Bacteriophytochrome cph2 [Achromobacter kerstersii]
MLSVYKVLVLDDHPFQCAQMRGLLEDAGFEQVDMASTAEEALEKARLHSYELILMELNMPGMDGVQFIHELARQHLSPMLAITTACSRRIMNSVSLMAKEKGLAVIGAYTKPVTRENAQALANRLRQARPDPVAHLAPILDPARLFERQTLEKALNTGQIQAWFQPKKALATGNIVGAEALARWHHEEFGFMLPASFLGAVRHHGLDHALLMRMLEDALTAYRRWRHMGFKMPVSVNLPTRLLDEPDLPDQLYNLVAEQDVPFEDVTFELLEDDTATLPGQYYMGASRLRLKGFGLAQDDFGKGYNSMYTLISTPFTELKIDRAFVSGVVEDGVRAAALLSSVQLGRQLGLLITAEGVETTKELEFLRDIGCDFAQGFLISAAVNAHDFTDLLANEPRPYATHPL